MSKFISSKTRGLLLVLAVVWVVFTVVWLIHYSKWSGKRSIEDLAGMVDREQEVLLNEDRTVSAGAVAVIVEAGEAADEAVGKTLYQVVTPETPAPEGAEVIDVDEGTVFEGTLIDGRALARLTLADNADEGFAVRGEGTPIGPNATAIYQILNFLFLLVVLVGVLWNPVLKMLDERAERIQTDLDSAQEDRTEAAKLKTDYEGMLDEGRRERSDLIAKGEKMGQDQRQRLLQKAEDEVSRIRRRADEQARALEDQVRRELRGELAGLTRTLAERVLRREVHAEDHEQMVKEFVAGLEKTESA